MSSPPSTPKVRRASVRKLVLDNGDEDEFLTIIGEVWEDMTFQDFEMDSQVVKQLNDSDFLHKVKKYYLSFSLARKKWGCDYVDNIVNVINYRLQTLQCGCSACNVRWYDF